MTTTHTISRSGHNTVKVISHTSQGDKEYNLNVIPVGKDEFGEDIFGMMDPRSPTRAMVPTDREWWGTVQYKPTTEVDELKAMIFSETKSAWVPATIRN